MNLRDDLSSGVGQNNSVFTLDNSCSIRCFSVSISISTYNNVLLNSELLKTFFKIKFDIGINFKKITCRVNNFIGKRVGFSSVNYQRGRNWSSGIRRPLSLGIGGSLSMSVGNSSQK